MLLSTFTAMEIYKHRVRPLVAMHRMNVSQKDEHKKRWNTYHRDIQIKTDPKNLTPRGLNWPETSPPLKYVTILPLNSRTHILLLRWEGVFLAYYLEHRSWGNSAARHWEVERISSKQMHLYCVPSSTRESIQSSWGTLMSELLHHAINFISEGYESHFGA